VAVPAARPACADLGSSRTAWVTMLRSFRPQ
jgi:hypothetical protein